MSGTEKKDEEEIRPDQETTKIVTQLMESLETDDEQVNKLVREMQQVETFATIFAQSETSDPDVLPGLESSLLEWQQRCQALTSVLNTTEKAVQAAMSKAEKQKKKEDSSMDYHG